MKDIESLSLRGHVEVTGLGAADMEVMVSFHTVGVGCGEMRVFCFFFRQTDRQTASYKYDCVKLEFPLIVGAWSSVSCLHGLSQCEIGRCSVCLRLRFQLRHNGCASRNTTDQTGMEDFKQFNRFG